jgi:hypothetical protein
MVSIDSGTVCKRRKNRCENQSAKTMQMRRVSARKPSGRPIRPFSRGWAKIAWPKLYGTGGTGTESPDIRHFDDASHTFKWRWLATSASYDKQSGAPISATGMNPGQTAQVTQYDPLLRLTAASLPNGGQVTASYSPTQIGTYQTMSSSETAQTQTLLDTYGRTSRVAVYNGQSSNSWYQVDYCYDATGLLQFQSTTPLRASAHRSGDSRSSSRNISRCCPRLRDLKVGLDSQATIEPPGPSP